MQKNKNLEIHRDSEILNYEGQIEFTPELVEFFEEERKRKQRVKRHDDRNIAFENLDFYSNENLITRKEVAVDTQVETNILLKQVFDIIDTFTEVEKRRFILNRVVGLKMIEIAEMEKVHKSAVKFSIDNAEKKLKKRLVDFI